MMRQNAQDDAVEETKGKKSSLVVTVLAAVFILAIVVTGTVMIVMRDDDPGEQAASSAPPSQAPPSQVEDRGDGYGQPVTDPWGRRVEVPVNPYGQVLPQNASEQLKESDPGWLTETAKGVQWQMIFHRPVPFSTSDGPERIDGKVASGFAHTPQGATLAAFYTFHCIGAYGEGFAPECFEKRATDGPNHDNAQAAAKKLGSLPRQGDDVPTLPGFKASKVENYADDYASILVAIRDQTSVEEKYIVLRAEMLWEDGDWKLKPTATGQSRTDNVTSFPGFTQW